MSCVDLVLSLLPEIQDMGFLGRVMNGIALGRSVREFKNYFPFCFLFLQTDLVERIWSI